MNMSSLSVEEAKEFLAANPTVQWIDAFVLDMNGHPRGKRLRRDDLIGIAKSGMMLPASVFIMDPRGNCIEETGRLWTTGDPDYNFRMLSGSLKAVPVNGTRLAQAVIVPEKDDPLDPRFVLRKQVKRSRQPATRRSRLWSLNTTSRCLVQTDSSPSMPRAACRATWTSR